MFVALLAIHIFYISPILSLAFGFIVSGCATAILMPIFIKMKERETSLTSSLSDVLLLASAFDNLFSLIAFNFCKHLAFGLTLTHTMLINLMGTIIGCALGFGFGNILKLLDKKKLIFKYLIFLITYPGLILMVFLLDKIDLRISGYIMTLLTLLILNESSFQKEIISRQIKRVWFVMRILLFICVGVSLNFSEFRSTNNIPSIMFLIITSSIVRIIAVYFSSYSFNLPEKTFSSVCWIPKASLQAALSSTVLYEAKLLNRDNFELISEGKTILFICFLYIVVTATFGSILMSYIIKKFKKKKAEDNEAMEFVK